MGWTALLVGLAGAGCGPAAVPCEPAAIRRAPLIERHFDYVATLPPALRSRAIAVDTLQPQDRIAVSQNRANELRVDGPVDVTVSAVQLSGGPGGTTSLWRSDRYAMLSLGTSAAVELGGVALRASVANASIRRKRDVLPTPARRLSTDVTTAGLELSADGTPRLAVDYLRIGRPRTRAGLDTPALLDVGGPAAGRGLRLSLSGGGVDGAAPSAGWRVALSSLHRPVSDGARHAGERLDAQAEARWTMTFR